MLTREEFVEQAQRLFVEGMSQVEAALKLSQSWDIEDELGQELMRRGCQSLIGELTNKERRGAEDTPQLRAPRRSTVRSGRLSLTSRPSIVEARTKFLALDKAGILEMAFEDVKAEAELYWAQAIGHTSKAQVFDKIYEVGQSCGMSNEQRVAELPDEQLVSLDVLVKDEWKVGSDA